MLRSIARYHISILMSHIQRVSHSQGTEPRTEMLAKPHDTSNELEQHGEMNSEQ